MSTSALLLIALASVVLLLLLVIKAKAHPFVALLIVSLLVAFATGIPADKIITTKNLPVAEEAKPLFDFLINNRYIVDIENYDEKFVKTV